MPVASLCACHPGPMRMAAAFAAAGCRLTMVFPYIHMKENLPLQGLHARYGVPAGFTLRILPTPLSERFPARLQGALVLAACWAATAWILVKNAGRLRSTVFVARDVNCVLPALVMRRIFGRMWPVRIVPQLHELKDTPLKRFAYRMSSGLMVNVPAARDDVIRDYGIPAERILVMNAPMVDFSKTDCSKAEARQRIGYEDSRPLVVYTGKISARAHELLYILDAAVRLPDYRFLFTGGKEDNLRALRKQAERRGLGNILFSGFLDTTDRVRLYQLAADVLVSYYTPKDHRVEYNYPQKIQEYISTGNPVVTPLFAATADVLDGNKVFAVAPDDPASLAEGIRQAVEDKQLARQKAAAAHEASRKVTYDHKVGEFLAFFERLNGTG